MTTPEMTSEEYEYWCVLDKKLLGALAAHKDNASFILCAEEIMFIRKWMDHLI